MKTRVKVSISIGAAATLLLIVLLYNALSRDAFLWTMAALLVALTILEAYAGAK